MNKLSETYFTIGEFASLFKLSKQTLFYYERNNILRPAYIDENGYRYYSLEQYFIFVNCKNKLHIFPNQAE